MRVLSRPLVIASAALLLTLLAVIAPALFRRMDAFRVQTVEVSGTRYLTPEAALALSGITDSASVFDDPDAWAERLRAERLIAAAEVTRKLPGTLRIDVVETEPVAFVRTPELRPVDARGQLLPIAMGGTDLDLPVIVGVAEIGSDSVADERTRRLIEALLVVRAYDVALAAAVSEIADATGGGVSLLLREPAHALLLLPDPPDARTLQQVLLAFEHLRTEAPEPGEPTAFDALTHVDARYEDEVFVTMRVAGVRAR
ncbi:MAG TPA: FtsQ-type POTRA domain-containing protein [Longimicrobiales bacterium]|nr:FtsQ-type POTRA domain-containing protein [Longimicrobiales bacterium]